MLFYPGWSTMLAGYFIGYKKDWLPLVSDQLDPNHWHIIFLIIAFGMLMGSTFVLNQLADIKSDRKNEKLFIISNGYLSKKSALKEVIILSCLSTVLALIFNVTVGIFFVLFFLLTGFLYNFAPLSMKDRPWGSLLANTMMGWLAFAIGWSALNQLSTQVILDSLPYLFFNTALYLFTTLPDIEGDRMADKKTLTVLYGSKKIMIAACILFLAGLLFSLHFHDRQALLFLLFSMPFFVKILFTFSVSDSIRATKFAILFFALSVCLRWPYYFILMLAGYYATKFYFKKRFNLNYPNFAGA
jgi:4-hydroxybenzoate polyprenyltransferase